jgi:SpoVK/Ycf46/Vps4 family AAA+-type ATPase
MGARDSQWSSKGTDPVSIANKRICLALLKIFRNVSVNVSPNDYHDIGAPFWPLLQEKRELLEKATQKLIKRQSGRKRSSSEQDFSALVTLSTESDGETPDGEALSCIGAALILGYSQFNDLFDDIETTLNERVSRERLATDRNIEILARSLGLSSVEQAFLALACALELSSISTSLFRYPSTGSERVQALQHALCNASAHDIHSLMTGNGPLARSGLLKHGLSIQHDIEDGLVLSRKGSALLTLEISKPEDMAAAILKPLAKSKAPMTLEWPHLQDKTELIERLLVNALKQEASGLNILLYGGPGTGKSEFAQHLIRKLGLKGYQVEDRSEDHSPASRSERLASLVLTQIFAPAKESVIVLDEAEDIFQTDYNHPLNMLSAKSEPSKSWMNALLEGTRVPVIWISNRIGHIDPAYLRRFSYCLEFTATPRGVRRNIARAYLEPVGCTSAAIDVLANSEHVSPALLSTAAQVISLSGEQGHRADQVARNVLGDHLKAMGHELPAHVPARAIRFDLAYLNVKGNVTPTAVLTALQRTGQGTMLLGGPPGTGKTQLAAEIAQRLGRELVYKTAADINSMWYGESERNVAKMFTDCDATNEVLFLDEADTLLGARESAGQRADKAVTAEFLRRVEAFEGIFVCATNHSAEFDSAMMRRFMFRLNFLPLNLDQRLRLFQECALSGDSSSRTTMPELQPSSLTRLARLDQLTPGDFANVVKRVRSLQLDLCPQDWLDELEAEHATKTASSHSRIGFI